MKAIIRRLSVLVAVVSVVGEPLHAQGLPLTSDIPNSQIVAQQDNPSPEDLKARLLDSFDRQDATEAVPLIEQSWERQYEDYFEINFPEKSITAGEIAQTLGKVAEQTGETPALLYVFPQPQHLELVLVTPEGETLHQRVEAANQQVLMAQVRDFVTKITQPSYRHSDTYLPAAQQLYQWIIAPVEDQLQAQGIDTLIFCLGVGLRTLPFAALHDGQQFLVEKYSLGRIPAFKLTDFQLDDTVANNLKNSPVLAMGASTFEELSPLPAVPVELSTIAKDLWTGEVFLNQEFTLANLQQQRQQYPFKIVHLATHANFEPGKPHNSYIQLWGDKLTLKEMSQLDWHNPPIELLVLSACSTAIGDKEAEMGFAGLAVYAEVKSAIASLWFVSDAGTLALMTEFYRYLRTAPIKAEALRQAQIAMIEGQLRLQEGQLYSPRGNISLPPPLTTIEHKSLSHPYYWAAFTVVGNPW